MPKHYCLRCKAASETPLCPACQATPLENIESPHAMPHPAAVVTIEPCADRPCWIVRDASGKESLLTADRTSAELHAERLRIMGGTWRTVEQLCDMIMEQRRREEPERASFGGIAAHEALNWLHIRTHALLTIRSQYPDSEASKIAGQALTVGVSDTAKLAHAALAALGGVK